MNCPILIITKNNDLVQMLEKYVLKAYLKKKTKELEDARNFHENNFQNCIDINRNNHYLISKIFNDYIVRCYDHWWTLEYERKLNKLIKHRIRVYEDELNDYLELREIEYMNIGL